MTVTQKAMRKVISGSGWSNPLTHNVYLENVAHLKVYADGFELTQGVDYSVDHLQEEAGYEVTIASFAPGMEPVWYFPDVWVLSVEPPIDQPSDISLGGNFGAPFEDAIDLLTRRMQHIYDMALRAIKSPLTTDPSALDQDDLVMDPAFIADFETKYQTILTTAVQVGQDADAAQEAAEDAESAKDAAEAARDTTAGYMPTIQNWYDSVNVWQAQVAADKGTVSGYRTLVEGYRDEVEDDRINVHNDKVIASAAADASVAAQAAAEAARDLVLSTYDQFDDRYLGSKSANPSVDNDGNALVPGALFFYDGNGTPANAEMRIWRGDIWVAAYVSGTGFLVATSNLGDLASPATARTNLDVYSKAEVDAMPGSVASKTTPIDADSWTIWDSAASAWKRVTGTNLKAYLKSYFDTLYATATQGGKADSAVQPTAAQTLTNKTLTDPVIDGSITEEVYTITDGAGFVINPRNGGIQKVTLGANRTPTASGWVSGDSITLKIDDGTACTITWSTIGVVWVGGSAPTLATSGFTHIVLWRDGTTYYGKYVGDTAS